MQDAGEQQTATEIWIYATEHEKNRHPAQCAVRELERGSKPKKSDHPQTPFSQSEKAHLSSPPSTSLMLMMTRDADHSPHHP